MITTHLAMFSFYKGMGHGGTFGRSGLGGDDIPRRNPNRGWDREEYLRRKASEDGIVATLQAAYAELTGETVPQAIVEQAEQIVAKHADVVEDVPLNIDWAALANEYERVRQLIALWQQEQALREAEDEDEEILMLLFGKGAG